MISKLAVLIILSLPLVAQDTRAAAGLKEALQIGARNAISLTGRPDGFFRNEAIKILMPKPLQTVERGLRMAGMGSQVDAFVLSMNRAAERAVPKAGKIFGDAVSTMTFDDARQILTGGDTAATESGRGPRPNSEKLSCPRSRRPPTQSAPPSNSKSDGPNAASAFPQGRQLRSGRLRPRQNARRAVPRSW